MAKSGEKNYKRREDGRCAAMLKGRDIPCKRFAMAGQAVCAVHGGRAPQAKRAAAKRLATEKARAIMERSLALLDIDAQTAEKLDPREVLLGALRHAVVRHEWWLRVVVAQSDGGERPAALLFLSSGQYGDSQSVHVYESQLGHWHDRVIAAAKACIAAGLDERAVAAAEEQARAAIASAAASDIAGFERRLRAAGFDDEQVAAVLVARVGE